MLDKFSHLSRISPSAPCWCGSGIKYADCHKATDERLDSLRSIGVEVPTRSMIRNQKQIQGIRDSAKINVAVLDYVSENIQPGLPTETIDKWVYTITKDMGGIPAPLNYLGYPKSVCTSVNNEVCHGIPSPDIILKEGDIVNVDCSTEYKGYFSDSSRTFVVGKTTPEKQKLVDVARECVYKGLEQVKPWAYMGDMSNAIKSHARANGFNVVRDIGGHGCGIEFHEDPFVSYVLRKGTGMVFVPGMTFTIEPMINMGTHRTYTDAQNNWTVYTDDGKPSAQWEIQVLVTEDGNEVLSW